jgi:hypothetical protein
MTLFDIDIVRLLEQVLPARFGGVATDYQLVEQKCDGRLLLQLLVHPRVSEINPDAVVTAALDAIGHGTGAGRVVALAWRDAGVLKVERRPPIPTWSGKILHLQVQQPTTSA